MKQQIINIINFIRGCEPREPVDLVKPVREQIRLMQENHLRGTFLVQYDAMLDDTFVPLLKALDPEQFEIGVWHEIVEPEVKAVGIPWTGRFPWDWHVHCGFSMGYTPAEREIIADELFRKFKEVFGYYPRVFGSWVFDSHTVAYLSDKYGLDAICNCKEQFGTDGYTLWGGYYGQGYYPSRENVFLPAQHAERQLPVPIFRMLGSDPVYQYDLGLDPETGASTCQGVMTLEPVYIAAGGGGNPGWVDWYLRENFNGECLSFGYAQAGQENSFGWGHMGAGLEYQFPLFARLAAEGKIMVEPLGETGRRYKETYAVTPASTITAHTAFDDPDKQSVWYSSRFYRANVYASHGTWRIRDLHLFSEKHPDPYADTVCEGNAASYEALPVIDGNLNSGGGVLAGIFAYDAAGTRISADDFTFTEADASTAVLDWGTLTVTLAENGLTVASTTNFTLRAVIGRREVHTATRIEQTATTLTLAYRGTQYGVTLTQGRFTDAMTVQSENGCIAASFFVL